VGGGAEGKREGEGPVQDPGPPCRWEMQPGGTDFLSTTDVGRLVSAEEDVGSEVSEWGRREQEERGVRRRRCWVVRRDYRCCHPRPLSWHRQARSRGRVTIFFCFSFVIFLGAHIFFLLGEGQRELATSRHAWTADGHNLARSHTMTKQKETAFRARAQIRGARYPFVG